ncbi:uncharacterized protein FTJAE_3053 [Fusarium tjaetaba]|uniref:Uncharacterized protein n=1 Tax=Fusarium tjaetaba TaxID=1567544 RepID=A0A8H5S372_9HYPO|nr:uncharacterized protein FTJAE_3053 [Fusarium tjaetaba]KAF5643754.1 hypothetical protein FTJAE_3053 [Fusarium tjaetaba]
MNEPQDPILEAAAEIAAIAKRLEQVEPPSPALTSQNWIGGLRPGDGDSDIHEDEDQDNGGLEDRWTDALAVTSGYNEQEFIRFFDEIHDDIVAKYRAPNLLP